MRQMFIINDYVRGVVGIVKYGHDFAYRKVEYMSQNRAEPFRFIPVGKRCYKVAFFTL